MSGQPIPLGRSILGMFAGYLLSVVLLLLLVALCYMELGTEGVFVANSYRDTSLFEILKLVCGCVAAIAAGWLAVRIGGMRAAVMLAVLMAVTGLVNGSISWSKQESRKEPWLERAPGPVNFIQAGENTQNSALYIFSLPFVSIAGSLAGGALCAAIQRRR